MKNIPLSPQLSKSFCEGRHDELHHVLLEVQTLAALDHANIVRYHTTWVEEPQGDSPVDTSPTRTGLGPDRQQLLLGTQPHSGNTDDSAGEPSFSVDQAQLMSCGFVFAKDSEPLKDQNTKIKLLTEKADYVSITRTASEPSANASDIFTDGAGSHLPLVENQNRTEPEYLDTYALYTQMSLYPMTLFHYLSASPVSDGALHPRHCFHLAPSLHIFSAILSGLRYLWAKQLVHRDVKPRNIFLSAPGSEPLTGYCDVSCPRCCTDDTPRQCWLNPRIGDSGLVTQLAHGKLPAGRGASKTVGTPFYRPPAYPFPDVADKGKEIVVADDEQVDIFALGVVFVELLCPFTTAMERADVLAGLQKGVLPEGMRCRLEMERWDTELVGRVLEMATGMVNPDPAARWTGDKIAKVAKSIKAELSSALSHKNTGS